MHSANGSSTTALSQTPTCVSAGALPDRVHARRLCVAAAMREHFQFLHKTGLHLSPLYLHQKWAMRVRRARVTSTDRIQSSISATAQRGNGYSAMWPEVR